MAPVLHAGCTGSCVLGRWSRELLHSLPCGGRRVIPDLQQHFPNARFQQDTSFSAFSTHLKNRTPECLWLLLKSLSRSAPCGVPTGHSGTLQDSGDSQLGRGDASQLLFSSLFPVKEDKTQDGAQGASAGTVLLSQVVPEDDSPSLLFTLSLLFHQKGGSLLFVWLLILELFPTDRGEPISSH